MKKSFEFSRNEHSCNLVITWPWGRMRSYNYPLSYTIEDCLEDWCASRGENFISSDSIRKRRGCTIGKVTYHGKIRIRRKARRQL